MSVFRCCVFGQVANVSSPRDGEYIELIGAIERAHSMIQTLEAAPSSHKREAALDLLRARHHQALTRLREIQSDSHRN